MTTIVPNNNQQEQVYQDKVLSSSTDNLKTEQPQQQPGLITPPMSPTNPASSISSVRNNKNPTGTTNTARSSIKVTAGQTGLPWLAHDAERSATASPIQTTSPEQLTQPERDQEGSPTTATAGQNSINFPPPKFMAHPKTTSIIRIPTRKRTMQKHVYSMKDGLDPVKVLLERLSNWQVSVRYLTNMFQSIIKVESTTGKGYRKINSKFTIPTKLEDQFMSSNGVKDAWSAFRQYTRENSLIHQGFVDFIENEIVPTLNVMLKEIAHCKVELKKKKELRTTTLWDCRKKTDAVITRLNNDIYATQNQQEKQSSQYIVPKKDPLLTKYVVINTIQDLHKQENRLHKEFLKTQDKYRQFEREKIINIYTQLFKSFEGYQIEHHLESLGSVSKVVTLFNAIEQDAEWIDFLHHHENELVKPTAAFKDERALDFPNAAHPLVQPLLLGNLQRHHGKKWTDEYYLLSSVGLLYRFKNEKRFHQSPTKPDLTMFVPQCTVLINPTSHLLELSGKTLSGLFGGSKKLLELSSSQPHIIQQWIEILGPIALEQETAVIKDAVPPISAGAAGVGAVSAATGTGALTNDDRSVHSKVLQEDGEPAAAAVEEAEHSKSGNSAIGGTTAAIDDTNHTKEMQQPANNVQHEEDHIVPITNNPSHVSSTAATDEDNGDHYKRGTIEYSTHTPLADQDQHNPSVTNTKEEKSPTAAITNNTGITMNDVATSKPTGPTREGSDLYWDTKTSDTAL